MIQLGCNLLGQIDYGAKAKRNINVASGKPPNKTHHAVAQNVLTQAKRNINITYVIQSNKKRRVGQNVSHVIAKNAQKTTNQMNKNVREKSDNEQETLPT